LAVWLPLYIINDMTDKEEKEEKHKTIERLLEEDYVLLHIDPKNHGVQIPPYLKSDPSVTLKLSRAFRGDLTVSRELVSAELLFSGEYFTCEVPIEAVWGLTGASGKNLVWFDCAPSDVLSSMLKSEEGSESFEPEEPVITGSSKASNNPSEVKRKASILRRVK